MEMNQEQLDAIARKMASLYVTNRERFVVARNGSHFIPKIRDRPMRLADSNLRRHLQKEYCVSVFASSGGSGFLCFDVDTYEDRVVSGICRSLRHFGIDQSDIHISISGRKGYHVELFFDEVIPLHILYRFYRAVLAHADLVTDRVECRPTDKAAIKLPLCWHPAAGGVCWFVDPVTLAHIKDYDYLLGIQPIDGKLIHKAVEHWFAESMAKEERPREERPSPAQTRTARINIGACDLPKLVEPGTRHALMLEMAIALRGRGVDRDNCHEILYQWLEEQDPDAYTSSPSDIRRDVRYILNWTYRGTFKVWTRDPTLVYLPRASMQRLMSRQTETERKTLFLLLISGKYQEGISQARMAELAGLSHRGVNSCITGLMRDGVIAQDHGIVKRTRKGHRVKKPSAYTVLHHEVNHEAAAKWPSEVGYTAVRLPRDHEQFNAAFYGAIHDMFGHLDLARRLPRRERITYQQCLEAAQNTTNEKATGNACSIKTREDT